MTSAGSEYADHDRCLALNFAEVARETNTKRIIYLGGLGETGKDLSEQYGWGLANPLKLRLHRQRQRRLCQEVQFIHPLHGFPHRQFR